MPARPPKRRDPSWLLPESPASPVYAEVLARAAEGDFEIFVEVALNDFWFFIRHVLTLGRVRCGDRHLPAWYGKPWFDHPYLFSRCREFQAEPYGYLDLEPRYHFKTAIRTQSHALWEAMDDENLTQMIVTNKLEKVGKTFLYQIGNECVINPLLHAIAPWSFFQDPEKESNLWTRQAINFRRTDNAHEPNVSIASLEAGATSQHPKIRRYDDLVTEDAVRSMETIHSTTERWRDFAGTASDEVFDCYTGTHWAMNDTYRVMLDDGVVKLRRQDVYGPDGETPQLRSREWVTAMRRVMGPYRFACQIRNSPVSAGLQTFQPDWLVYDEIAPEERAKKCNVYVFADTAGSKKKANSEPDYNVFFVVGLGQGVPLGKFYILDLVRDRMGLVRWGEILFEKVDQWRPHYTFLEQVGAMRDGQYAQALMREKNFDFRLIEVSERTKKENRISALQPLFEQRRIVMPREIRGTTDGMPVNLIDVFKQEEFLPWSPSAGSTHDDMLDTLAWITSPEVKGYLKFPDKVRPTLHGAEKRFSRRRKAGAGLSWAAM